MLPVVQTCLAGALKANNYVRGDMVMDPAWSRLDIQICYGLNAPAALVNEVMFRVLPNWLPWNAVVAWSTYFAFFPLLILVWYCVGYEIDYRERYRVSALAPKLQLRWTADIVLICLGLTLGGWAILIRREFEREFGFRGNVFSIPYFAWAVVLVLFYSKDLWDAISTGVLNMRNLNRTE
ncbi:MAG TPA: hypothetical protein VN577_16020 [Terriglobales bacterium]|nr:hypothetical protein [Terriglobales bacterium]